MKAPPPKLHRANRWQVYYVFGTIEEMRQLLDSEDFDFRFDVGLGLGQPTSLLMFTDRERLVQSFAMHYSVLHVKAELDQLLEGLGFPQERPVEVLATIW